MPMATGSTGQAENLDHHSEEHAVNTSVHGILPPMTPSTTIFIIMACGAPSSSVPKPHAALSR